MGLGNGNPNSGNKGSNWRYEYDVLRGLSQIAGNTAPVINLATEATLLQVLSAIQNGQEFEQNLVIDKGGAGCPICPTYTEIRIWDTVNHVFGPPTYYNAAGAVVVPVGPLEYINPQYVLNDILVQNTSAANSLISIDAGIPAALGQTTMAGSMPVTIASDQPALPVSLSVPLDFGVSTTALRVAALLGNATGIAAFGAGVTNAQTLRVVLPTDQTAIPVTQSTSPWVISAASLPLPTGAATEATLLTVLTIADFQARINTLGQKTMAASTPVVLASDQSSIPVTGPLTDAQLRATPVPVSGTVTAAEDKNYGIVGANTLRTAAQIGNSTGAANFGAGTTTAQTLRVVLPTDQTAIPVSISGATPVATSTNTSVARNAASVILLASNASRKGATIYNDAASNLYIRFAATATTAAFTTRLQNNDYYEVPFGYTGDIAGIWAAAGMGNALMSELT